MVANVTKIIFSLAIVLGGFFVFVYPALAQNIWGDEGFWGNTGGPTNGEGYAIGIVGDGVRATTEDQAPGGLPGSDFAIFVMVMTGIGISFILFDRVAKIIFKSIAKNKKTKIDILNDELVTTNKKIDELSDFYSKNGGASDEVVKQVRKRGRPRKNT